MARPADTTPMPPSKPPFRPLRAYAFNPTLALSMSQAIDNEVTLKVPWEEDLRPGPVGEYVEVIDFDPGSECFYAPVDLNAPSILVQGGLPASEGVPQFHQQMVYALVMSTIRHFERGLGRAVLWSPRADRQEEGTPREAFVRRLRVYPHALRAQQTYYSPSKKALLLGYFPVEMTSATGEVVRATSFTCLSHGIVAHETAHAILDGLRRTVSLEESGADELAVQEALADLVGLLQQFAIPGFLREQVRLTSDLDENQRLLEEMARRLAQPAGVQAELRKQIGALRAQHEQVNPRILRFQERAALLVAAVFDAFTAVWRKRCARLLGLSGFAATGRQPLAGDLLDALSAEAATSASHLLHLCIRAIDYCPPTDVTLGDYLRALVTADTDVSAEDERRYRVALVEAFRRHGLYPLGTGALSPLHLLWRPPQSTMALGRVLELELEPAPGREKDFEHETRRRDRLQSRWLGGSKNALTPEAGREMGLALDRDAPRTIERTSDGLPRVSVDSCRLACRTGPDAQLVTDWVITMTQRRRGYFDPATQDAQDAGGKEQDADFIFRGGCTLLVDATTGQARFCIAKDILASARLARHRESAQQRMAALATAGDGRHDEAAEPFAALRGSWIVPPLKR